jgi:hypothetical protein
MVEGEMSYQPSALSFQLTLLKYAAVATQNAVKKKSVVKDQGI